jgi:hypothetical protein
VVDDAKSGDLSNLDQLNSEAFKIYNTKALEPCPGCNRTFKSEALEIHVKICQGQSGIKIKTSGFQQL